MVVEWAELNQGCPWEEGPESLQEHNPVYPADEKHVEERRQTVPPYVNSDWGLQLPGALVRTEG